MVAQNLSSLTLVSPPYSAPPMIVAYSSFMVMGTEAPETSLGRLSIVGVPRDYGYTAWSQSLLRTPSSGHAEPYPAGGFERRSVESSTYGSPHTEPDPLGYFDLKEASNMDWKIAFLRPPTMEGRKASVNHPTSMFQIAGLSFQYAQSP